MPYNQPRVQTPQDARQRAFEISHLTRLAYPMTLNGFTFYYDFDAATFVMVAGNVPMLGDRFTIAELGDYLWQQRAAFNAAIDAHQLWPNVT